MPNIIPATDHEGRPFPSEKAMCQAWGTNVKTYCNRKKRGWDLKSCLTGKEKPPKPEKPARDTSCADHLENRHPSQAAMLAAYGVERSTFAHRIKNGATLAQALGQEPMDLPTSCEDHLRNRYPTKKAMCEHWGLTRDTYNDRIAAGWSQKDALETPLKDNARPVKDHLDNEYPSFNAMAGSYGITPSALRSRLDRGYSLEQALTTPSGELRQPSDHTGRTFRTQKEMCAAWGVNISDYHRDRQAGLTVEQALTRKRRVRRDLPKTDHLGQEWPSTKAMCGHWGVNVNTFLHGIEKGMSLEEALAQGSNAGRKQACVDCFGRGHKSAKAMAEAIHISTETMKYWAAKPGRDLREASAHACASYWPGTDAGRYRVRECLGFPWFLCEDMSDPAMEPHAGEAVLHAERVLALKDGMAGAGNLRHKAGSHKKPARRTA